MKEEIITGIDIGSRNIRIVVGQVGAEGRKKIIGGVENPSEGISKGVINSFEEAVAGLSKVIEKVEKITGFPCEHAFVGVSGTHIISQESKGVVAVAKADGEIKKTDVERVLEAAQAVATPPNYEILHVIPRVFSVDNQTGIRDPLGMTGVRLEVEARIIQGLSSQIRNLAKCVYRTGIEIDDLVFSILAASEAVLTRRQKELGVVLVDLGASTTSFAVFEEGDVLAAKVLPIGSSHITSDIAIGLRTSIDTAEQVKIHYGSALPDKINKREEIDLSEIDEKEEESVSRKHVAEIIEARAEEICKMVDKELKVIGRSGKLPAGVVLSGGGAKLEGIVELAKREFRLPVTIGYPQEIVTPIDKINDPSFATAVGLVLWGSEVSQKEEKFLSRFINIEGISRKIKKWFKSLVP